MTRRHWVIVWVGFIVSVVGVGIILHWYRVRGPVFEGELWLSPGLPGEVVLAAHDSSLAVEDAASLGLIVDAAAEELPIPSDAAALLPPNITFDAAVLPFQAVLHSAELLEASMSSYVLEFHAHDRPWEQAIEPGSTVAVEGRAIRVDAIQAWGGLLRQADGPPMADVSVALDDGGWVSDVFLAAGSWVRAGSDLALCLEWEVDTAPVASAEFPQRLSAARWGVVDGGAMQWTSSFEPGASFMLRDGRSVTLRGVGAAATDERELSVLVDGPGGVQEVEVSANTAEGAIVRFEDLGRLELSVVIRAETSRRAAFASYTRGELTGVATEDVGEVWESPDGRVRIRLEQLEAHALPLRGADSPLVEAVLNTGEGTVRVREGESFRWQDMTVVFQRTRMPASYSLRLAVAGDGAARVVRTAPGNPIRIGDWEFEPVRVEPREGGFTVRARRYVSGVPWAGLGVVVLGSLTVLFGIFSGSRSSL